MGNDTSHLKIRKTGDCIKYIESFGLTIENDNPELSINSKSGLIYTLQNGEVVLLPSNLDLNYPGIIFKNKTTFFKYSTNDFFPIGDQNMTWLERNYGQMKKLKTNGYLPNEIPEDLFLFKMPFKNSEEIKDAFLKIQSKITINNDTNETLNNENLIYAFGLSVIYYLKEYKDYNWYY